VPVNVDAIVFWHVRDARKASLEQAIDRVAQTSLREMIGSSMLQPSCLTGRLLTGTFGTRLATKPLDGACR
jgi:regulator of protease activity HflC (stomatin/prohibitin superfamily)